MHLFWKNILHPVLTSLHPKSIVEIGSDYGINTHNLLKYCVKNSSILHSIDPFPKFDVKIWQEKYGKIFKFYKSISLNTIQLIDQFDIVLIDGDHNWYTVFNELKLIEKHSVRISQPFPLIMLHDIGWPYGRRDLYYNPYNIPEVYRKPYAKAGLVPDSNDLFEMSGFNPHLFNSIYENELQNGVLTAIEDFLQETTNEIEFFEVQGLHGLGILILREYLSQNVMLSSLIEEFKFKTHSKKYINTIEKERIKAEIKYNDKNSKYNKIKKELESKLFDAKSELKLIVGEKEIIRRNTTILEGQLETIKNKLRLEGAAVLTHKSEIKELDNTIKRQNEKIKELDNTIKRQNENNNDLQKKLNEREKLFKKIEEKNENTKIQFKKYDKLLSDHKKNIKILTGWLDQLIMYISAILSSKRWRFGNMIGELSRRGRFLPHVPMATDEIKELSKIIEQWKKSRDYSNLQIHRNTIHDHSRKFENTNLTHKTSKDRKLHNRKLFYKVIERLLNDNPDNSFKNEYEQSENFIIETLANYSDNTEEPLVSIIMPTFNRAHIIANAIQSVIDQEYEHWELWVCDDGSTDNTKEIVTAFNELRINYIKFKNVGAASARNKGLSHAKGKYIAYLDSDNVWHPQYLNIIIKKLIKKKGYYSAYSKYIDIKITKKNYNIKNFHSLPFQYESLMLKNFIDLNAFVHIREMSDNFGVFDERLTRRQDYDLILKYTYLRDPLYIDAFLLVYQRNNSWQQITQTNKHDNSCNEIINTKIGSYFKKGLTLIKKPAHKSVTILSWDICRNHFSKAYNMAECLSDFYNVQLIGFRFFNAKIFYPYKKETPSFDTVYLNGSQFPDFKESFVKALANVSGDIIYAVKPRLPSLGLALLANYHFGKPFILEVNDLESVVSNPYKNAADIEFSTDSIELSNKELINPYSDLWSQIMEEFAHEVPFLVTHNRNIDNYFQKRCFYIRNHKDEKFYDPNKYSRDRIRQELGISKDDRIILFGGLLREHKGIFELVKLIKRLDDPRYKLLFVGSRTTPDQDRLKSKYGEFVRLLPPQNRNDMARINFAADIIIIWLDPSISASQYQMPFKLTDAFAMKIPVIANAISDIGDLGEKGYLRLVDYGDFDNMVTEIKKIFAEREKTLSMVERSRRLYLRQFSYNAAKTNFQIIDDIVSKYPKVSYEVSKKFAGFFGSFMGNISNSIEK